jgi:hypothetical protein
MYSINDWEGTIYPKKSHTDTLDIPQTEGQHSVEVYAKDIAGNLTNKVINFVFDVSNPSLNVSSPQQGKVYSTKPQNLFSVSDAVSGIDTENSYIKLNGNKIGWLGSRGDVLNLSEGSNTLEYYFVDKAGNSSSLTKNFSYDVTFPNIELETLEDTTNSSSGTLEWNITESNPKEMWYKFNGEKTNISNLQGSANINYQEGNNIVEVYAKDKTGKESSVTDSVFFTGEAPLVNLNSPVFDTNYNSTSIPLEMQITEENLDSANSYVKLNGNKRYLSQENWNDSLNARQGQNEFSYYLVDKFGNKTSDSGSFDADNQAPEISIIKPKSDTADFSSGTLEWDISEANPQEMWYKVNGEKTTISNLNDSSQVNFQEGQNILEVYANDKAGNESSVKDTLYYSSTGINQTPFADYSVKAYPNPTKGDFKIQYNFQSPQDGRISIYNTKGQNLEEKLIQGKGEGVKRFNVSGSKGVYFYRVKTESGYEKTGKIVKE